MRIGKEKKKLRCCAKENEQWYDNYIFTWKDWSEFLVFFLLKGAVICYLFYDTWKMGFLLLPLAFVDYNIAKKRKLEQQKRALTTQFQSMIESVSNSLSAGYSFEKCFMEAKRDLHLIYPESAVIFKEVNAILTGLQMNVPIEQLLSSFGKRSGVDDITNFANVVTVAKRSGGNLVRIIQKTISSISDKLLVEEEIETMIAAKKYEEKIMMLMPYGIIFYLRITNAGYFDVLYHNILGIAIMTIFLIIIEVADVWARKIMEIRV